jgi:hypothetical protein
VAALANPKPAEEGVAKTLIEEGIRQVIKDGFLKQRPAAAP